MGDRSRLKRYLHELAELENHLLQPHQVTPSILFVIRLVSVLYLAALCAWRRVYLDYPFYEDFKYLTVWGLAFVTAYFVLVLLEYIPSFRKLNLGGVTNVIFEIGFSVQLTVTMLFWFVVFPAAAAMTPDELGYQMDTAYIILTTNMHGGVLFVIWFENLINMVRFHKEHYWIIIVFSIFYVFINVGFTILEEPVYVTLNWKNFASFMDALLATLVSLLHFYIGYKFFKKVKVQKGMANTSVYYRV
eukprot:TRINITY_DN8885_c0_g1_i3.p1 TRINITY_DN8885_c0_g1~~TRINITY_DN8885_c0_g1_i3.p1  ORF type:complete len:246 (+),score=29.02 TRINITY_DN8885_c0_g1_i3:248-985(+)